MTSYLCQINEQLYISPGDFMKLEFIFRREGVVFQLWMCHSNPTAFSNGSNLGKFTYILTDPTEVNTQHVTVCYSKY